MRTLNEQIQRLRDALVTCYKAIKRKGGTIPEEGERTLLNMPAAVLSIPQSHGKLTELKVTANGVYLPEEGVDGFSKVTAEFEGVGATTFPSDDFWGKLVVLGDAPNFVDGIEINKYNFRGTELVFTNATTIHAYYSYIYMIGSTDLKKIYFPKLKENTSISYGFFINNSKNVEYIFIGANGKGNDLKTLFWGSQDRSKILDIEFEQGFGHSININDNNGSSPITRETIVEHMLKRLYDFSADPMDGFSPTLVIGDNWLNRLTIDDIAIATNKGWTLV